MVGGIDPYEGLASICDLNFLDNTPRAPHEGTLLIFYKRQGTL